MLVNSTATTLQGKLGLTSIGTKTITPNTWHYLTLTWSGTTGAFYVDGQNNTTPSTISSLGSFYTRSSIGCYYDQTQCSKSKVDQLRIFNYAWTPAQIAYDYNRGAPVGWWKFDECQGATAYDSSGNSNNGTITIGGTGSQTTGGTCTTPTDGTGAWYNGISGKRNYSLNFDGTDDYVSLGAPTDLDFAAPGSVSAWVKTSSDSCRPIYAVADTEAPNNGWIIYTGSCTGTLTDEIITISRYKDGSTADILGYTTANRNEIVDGNWHLVTATADGSTVKIYIDGIQKTAPAAPVFESNNTASQEEILPAPVRSSAPAETARPWLRP